MITKMLKKGMMVAMLSAASVLLFAASGGKGKKTVKSKTVTKMTIGKISLRSNYEFKGNKLVTLTPKRDFKTVNQYTTIQKGNKTMVVANKSTYNKPVLTVENNSSNIQVKLIKLKLN
jgi:hypothetical protein